MRKHIEYLKSTTTKKYIADHSEVIRDFNQENETIKGYNGRQLLELLQNCDDENSKEVLIRLNTSKNEISIHNNGTPFSKKGYRSLFIPNLSSKTDTIKYIGNKGLGFRSIINWSKKIEIQSNNLSLIYSKNNVLDTFNELFNKERQQNIRKEEKIPKGIIPFPFLTMPIVNSIIQDNFTTSIIINYKKDAFTDIIKQVKSITPETILFLKNIENIKFEGFEDDSINNIYTERKRVNKNTTDFKPKEEISYNNTIWQIFEEEGKLEFENQDLENKKNEHFQIKIAVEKSMSKTVPTLYSFFPTNIDLDQPYILHATFELDSTRNQLVDSVKNKLILEKVVLFTIKVAKFFASKEVSYKPLEILNHKHKSDTLKKLGYYELIEQAINSEDIMPCIDNTYKSIVDSIYISDEFGQMLLDIEANKHINIHILPMQNRTLLDFNLEEKIDRELDCINDIVNIINDISKTNLSNNKRALFISQIVKNAGFVKSKHKNKIDFFTNDKKTISGEEYIYTPITKDFELKKPSFSKIYFINKDLFQKLLTNLDYDPVNNNNKGRFISDKLNGFCNIHSYEPSKLAQKIISETKVEINKNKKKAISLIKEMNYCLFYNYNIYNDGTKIPDTISIPTITKSRKIKYINSLMLSDFYPIGKKTELIFNNIYSNDNYIGSPKTLGLDSKESDINNIENFIKWLGVNEYAEYKQEKDITSGVYDYWRYIKGLHSEIDNRYKTTFHKINNFKEIISKISIEKLILWIYFDNKLKRQIDDVNNDDNFYHYYYSYNYVSTLSYIKFQINTLFPNKINDYLVEEKYNWVNNFKIDYRKVFFLNNNISKTIINEILIKLGANDSFNTLSISKVSEILNKLHKRFPDGKKTQSIYKKALSHYHTNQQELTKDIILFAEDGSGLKPFKQSEIYFSDKIRLPNQLRKNYPIFNFPSRAGGADAIRFFGINDLKDIKIEITESGYTINERLTNEFQDKLTTLKPLILTYRLNAIEDTTLQKIQASICNRINIILCDKIDYQINDYFSVVDNYEFLHYEEYTYLIKISKDDTINDLYSNQVFVNSFADIIALSLDVTRERNEYKQLLRNKDIAEDIINDFGIDTYNDARELLGLADYKQAFWKAIYTSMNIEFEDYLDDLALEKHITEYLKIEFNVNSLNYEDINSDNEINKVKELFSLLKINLKDFANHYSYNIDLSNNHFYKIRSKLLSKKNDIKSSIWKLFKNKSTKEKSNYLNEINKFESYFDYITQASNKNKHTFEINIPEIIDTFINNLYGNIIITDDIDVNKLRKGNLKHFNTDEIYLIGLNERFKNLIYFKSELNTIKEELEIESESTVEEQKNDKTKIKIEPILGNSDTLAINIKRYGNNTKNRKSVFTPKEKNQKRLKQKGDSAEEIVYDYLVENNFKNVDQVAKDNEGLQCDIRYLDNKGNIKFVEVKSFDSGMFYLSRAEYIFGKKEQDNYEIWLVKDKEIIIPIKDFFTNEKYRLSPSEYEVYLKTEE
jgi:hypothetical protein